MPEFQSNAAASVVIDDRYAPLIVSSFYGEIDLTLGQWYEQTSYRIIAREAGRGRRVVNIHDASHSTKSSPEMRKFWAEMSKRTPAPIQAAVLANVVVITSSVMRGVLTAVGWLNPEVAQLQIYPSLPAALARAAELLRDAGTPVDLPVSGYTAPQAERRTGNG